MHQLEPKSDSNIPEERVAWPLMHILDAGLLVNLRQHSQTSTLLQAQTHIKSTSTTKIKPTQTKNMNHLSSHVCQKACVRGRMRVHLHKVKMNNRCSMDNRSIKLFSNSNPSGKMSHCFLQSMTLRTKRMHVQLRNKDLTRKLNVNDNKKTRQKKVTHAKLDQKKSTTLGMRTTQVVKRIMCLYHVLFATFTQKLSSI